jgi:transcriptional regulator with XRE-family HTH domain
MGKAKRPRPERLHEKLKQIRESLDLSQDGIIEKLDYNGQLIRSMVSNFEIGLREPPLPLVLAYAKLARICTDVLLDDKLDLPEKLPNKPKHI